MIKINKITNIALIFALMVLMVWVEFAHAHGAGYLRVPLDHERVKIALDKTSISSTNKLINQAFLDLGSSDKEKVIEAIQFLSALRIKEAIGSIKPFLNHNDPDIKNMAMSSLGILGDKEIFKTCLSRLFNKEFKDINEARSLMGLLLAMNYEMGIKYMLELYGSEGVSYEMRAHIYSILREKRLRTGAIPLFKNFIEKAGYENILSVQLFIILAESGRDEARELLSEIIPKLHNERIKIIADNALKHLDYLQTKKQGELSDAYARYMSPEYFRIEELQDILDNWRIMPDSPQKLQTAILLGRRNQKEAVPYLNNYFKSGDERYRHDVKLTLLALGDERSTSVFSDIAFDVSGDEQIIYRCAAIMALKEIGTPEAVEILKQLSETKIMDIKESAQRAIYFIHAKKAGIPNIDIKDIKNDLPGTVWIPVRVSAENAEEDSGLKDKIRELIDNKVIIPWADMIKKETFWQDCFNSINLPVDDVYFAPVKDPSYIAVENGDVYPRHTGRSITINRGNVSYSLKNTGASVPFVKGALSLSYHDDKGVWFYGGRLRESGLTGEMTKALSIEEVIDEAFNDPALAVTGELYGVKKDLFLTPMVQIEPLFLPVGIQKGFSKKDEEELGAVYFRKDGLAFIPVREGLRLADVPLEKFPDSRLMIYAYKNSSALDIRFAQLLLEREFNDEEWKYVFSSYGYKTPSKEVFNKVLQGTAARFASFILVLHDYLKFSKDEVNGDTFTHQNINPFVIFDYDTFSSKGYKDENMRNQILDALGMLHELADYFELSEEDKYEADKVFREVLTREIVKKKRQENANISLNIKEVLNSKNIYSDI